MEQNDEWVNKYFTPEQQAAIADSRHRFDSGAGHAQYAKLEAGLQQATAEDKSADSAEVQKLIADLLALIGQPPHGAQVNKGVKPARQNKLKPSVRPQAPTAGVTIERASLDGTTPIQNKK